MYSKALNWLLDLLFPKTCLGCGQEEFYLCPDCLKKITINKDSLCFICGQRTLNNQTCPPCQKKTKLAGLLIASQWDNLLLRQMIYEYKYKFVKDLAQPLSQIIIQFLINNRPEFLQSKTSELILTPVPLHPRRLVWRGYNQAEILAQEIGKYFNLPVIKLIERIRPTLPQANINNQKERQKNIKMAFGLAAKNQIPMANKIIILIDDVCTTGSTLEECAQVLTPLKIKEIWGLVLARG